MQNNSLLFGPANPFVKPTIWNNADVMRICKRVVSGAVGKCTSNGEHTDISSILAQYLNSQRLRCGNDDQHLTMWWWCYCVGINVATESIVYKCWRANYTHLGVLSALYYCNSDKYIKR